jgi:sugar phosphate isomerase/epimerase
MDTGDATGIPGDGADQTAAVGDAHADWGEFLSAHRDRLRRMVSLRLDQRLRGGIDPSDVSRYLRALRRLKDILSTSEGAPTEAWL